MSEVVQTLEDSPDFPEFMADGQTSLIEDALEVRPDLLEPLQNLIRRGRIRIGPWFTMPDLWLADGESLIRNLLAGRADCLRYQAKFPNLGYVPDSFGHGEQMPQILNGFGIDNYIFSRGMPLEGEDNKLEFLWTAPDGMSQVTAHRLPRGYQNGALLPPAEDEEALRAALTACEASYARDSADPSQVLVLNGVDHIRIQADLPAILERARQLFPEDEIVPSSLENYLREFSPVDKPLLIRSGTLRGKRLSAGLLEGTWSSRIDLKIENARTAMVLQNWAEPLAALAASLTNASARTRELELAWKWLLQNHAHDSICGCSIDRVNADVRQRFIHCQEIAELIASDSINLLARTLTPFAAGSVVRYAGLAGAVGCEEFLFDSLEPTPPNWIDVLGEPIAVQSLSSRQLRRHDVVVLRGTRQGASGEEQAVKHHDFWEHRVLVQFPPATPCSIETFQTNKKAGTAKVANPVQVGPRSLENDILAVSVLSDGSLTLTNKASQQVYHGLLRLTDEADAGGGYSFLPVDGDEPVTTGKCQASVAILEPGPLRGALRISLNWDLPTGLAENRLSRSDAHVQCHWTLEIRLETGSPILQVKAQFENRAKDHRLRLLLPLPFLPQQLQAERAFYVATEIPGAYPSDPGQDNHPMRSWLAAEGETSGIAFVGKGLHEWSLRDQTLLVTLLRSVPFVGTCGSWETPDAQLIKKLSFEFALVLFNGTWRESAIPQQAARFLQPSAVVPAQPLHPSWSHLPHASIRFEEIQNTIARETSSWRPSWIQHANLQDGWRREVPPSPAELSGKHRLCPVVWDDPDILLSAFKSQGGRKVLLRFYSLAADQRRVVLRSDFLIHQAHSLTLSEEIMDELTISSGEITLDFLPYAIRTVTLELQSDETPTTPDPSPLH